MGLWTGTLIRHNTKPLYCTRQVLPDAGVNPSTGTRAGSTAFYSLDEGKTRFYDLMQMVEFYTLNQGALNARLTQVNKEQDTRSQRSYPAG